MNNGTIKSEVWTHYTGVAQEYFRFEVITRYWDSENDELEWKHTVIRIDRDGSVSDATQKEEYDHQSRDLRNRIASFVTTGDSRIPIVEQHHQLVRIALACG